LPIWIHYCLRHYSLISKALFINQFWSWFTSLAIMLISRTSITLAIALDTPSKLRISICSCRTCLSTFISINKPSRSTLHTLTELFYSCTAVKCSALFTSFLAFYTFQILILSKSWRTFRSTRIILREKYILTNLSATQTFCWIFTLVTNRVASFTLAVRV